MRALDLWRRRRLVAGLAVVLGLALISCGDSGDSGGGVPADATPTPTAPVGTVNATPIEAAVVVEAQGCPERSLGSGVVLPEGVVTNAHVVAGSDRVVVRNADGQEMTLDVVAFDPVVDLALLVATDGEPVAAPASLVASDAVRAPGSAITIWVGGSGSVEPVSATLLRTVQLRVGDIYGEGSFPRAGLELSAMIGEGDSGAAVVDGAGNVIGLVFSRSSTTADLAYGVAAAAIVDFLDAAAASGTDRSVDTGACTS